MKTKPKSKKRAPIKRVFTAATEPGNRNGELWLDRRVWESAEGGNVAWKMIIPLSFLEYGELSKPAKLRITIEGVE